MRPVPSSLLAAEWNAALADAGLHDEEVALWPVEGFRDCVDLAPACCYPAERDFTDERFLPGLERAGYDVDAERRPRVAFFVDFYDPAKDGSATLDALVAGLLRHELEHVKQHAYWTQRGVNLFELDGLVDRALELKSEAIGSLYNAKPTECDANAAASQHLKQRHDSARQAIHEGRRFGELARYRSGPEPVETLVPRMLAFCLLLRSDLEAIAAQFREPLADHVEYWGEAGTGGLWSAITGAADSWSAAARRTTGWPLEPPALRGRSTPA